MALALSAGAPIRVASDVMDEQGISAPEGGALREGEGATRVKLTLTEEGPRLEPVA
jgi:bifunctional DNase/RNase